MDLRRRNIVIAIMVAMFLGAIEGTVVTTAIPTIVRDLHGFGLISWVFSLYLLTSAISTPVYGKLSDLYGRKNILSIGIIIFLVGSSLCGLSRNMHQLIAFRALQGLGAGAIFTVTYTIIGDLFSLAERAKVQGWLSAVWGIASIVGPFLGGFLIDWLSWHWIFFICIPFGILSIVLLRRNLSESLERKRHWIDYIGMAVFSAAIITLLAGVLSGGKSLLLWSVLTTLLLVAFYFLERKAKEPIIPFEIITRNNTVVNIISFLAAAVLMGTDVYIPIYIQNILGFSATISGVSMAPMSVSWLLSSVFLGKAIPKYGEKAVIGFSTAILLLSSLLLPTLGVKSPLTMVIIYTFILGLGFGGSLTTLTIVIQASVGYNQRGAATALNSLVRTLGQTIGISIFGSIFNQNIVKYFNLLGIKGIELNSITGFGNGISLQNLRLSLNSAIHTVFIAFIIITAVCLALSFMLPSGLKEKSGSN